MIIDKKQFANYATSKWPYECHSRHTQNIKRLPNVIFLKPRKVAGTSFEIALSKFAGEEDIITPITEADEEIRIGLGFPKAQNFGKMNLTPEDRKALRQAKKAKTPPPFYRFNNHMIAQDVKEALGAKIFNAALKISIVRNPFDSIISMYFWQNRLRKKTPPFDAWLRKNPATIKQNYDHYFINDECIINHFIRFEHFQKDMMSLEKTKGMTGLWDTFKRINAKGGIRPKDATISATFDMHPEAVQVIEFFNKDLFDRFDYTAS